MDLRQLEYFQMVSRLNSISKAAKELHISQPSLSIAMQKLEEDLGVFLFDRSQRQICLTGAGQAFVKRVDDILMRIADAVVEMKDWNSEQRGEVKIGIPPMVGVLLFPEIFSRFSKKYPEIDLTATEAGSLSLRKYLEQGRLDIAILTTANVQSGLESIPIATGEIHVCFHREHALNRADRIPFAALADEPLILAKEDAFSRQLIMAEYKKRKIVPKVLFSSGQIETIVALVEQGSGIAFLSAEIAKKHTGLCHCTLEEPLLYQTVLTWNKNRYRNNATRAFLDFVTMAYTNGG